jgi:hypothetical protein
LLLTLCAPWPGAPRGDEPYYIEKAAHLRKTGRLPRATATAKAVLEHRALGYSDVRPPGYPVALAALAWGKPDDRTLRWRCGLAQFGWAALALTAVYGLACVWLPDRLHRLAIAALFGLQPWTFDRVRSIAPDSLVTSFSTLALVGLCSYLLMRGALATAAMIVSTLILSATFLLRPEMIVLVPPLVGLAIVLRDQPWRRRWSHALAAAACFAAVLSVQVGYRTYFIGRPGVFGDFVIPDRSVYDWVHTWFGTEHEMYDFVNDVSDGKGMGHLAVMPGRAFGDSWERKEIERGTALATAGGPSWESEAIFDRVARKRIHDNWLRSFALTRVWRTCHLWLNAETSEILLSAAASVPRNLRRPVLGGLLLLKVVCLTAFLWVAAVHAGRLRSGFAGSLEKATIVMAAFVVLRTVLIGLLFGFAVHRYILPAWPALLFCVAMATVEWARRRGRAVPISGHP